MTNFLNAQQSNNEKYPIDSFTDGRDGKTYKTVTIGNQTWMAENLKYKMPDSCWCVQCETYGRLYHYNVALRACPSGWHLADDEEWTTLTTYLGGDTVAGGKLKAEGTTQWQYPNTEATNEVGFSALPGGYCFTNGAFFYQGSRCYWWSSTESSSQSAWYRSLNSVSKNILRYHYKKDAGLSVRCLRN